MNKHRAFLGLNRIEWICLIVLGSVLGGSLYSVGEHRRQKTARQPILDIVGMTGRFVRIYHDAVGVWPDSVEQVPSLRQLRYQNWYHTGLYETVVNRRNLSGTIPAGAVVLEPLIEGSRTVGVTITGYDDKPRVIRRVTLRDQGSSDSSPPV